MKPKLQFISMAAVLCLLLSSCSLPATHMLITASATPTLLPPATDTLTMLPPATATPTLPASASATPADTATALIPPTPIALTPTLAGPALAHLVPGQKIDITFIHMVDVNQGWGIGGLNKASDHVFLTKDGGQTWRDVTPPQPGAGAGATITALGYFPNADTAHVAYGPPADSGGVPPFIQVWNTNDGGATWTYGSIDTSSVSGEAFSPYYLNFADSQHGWLMVYLGAGMMHAYVALFMTVDAGATWTDILDPYTVNDIQSFPKTGMVFEDPLTGWLTRDAQGVDPTPHIFRTTDGGVTWTRIDLPAPADAPNLYDSYSCSSFSPNAFSALSVTIAMKCLDNATFKNEKDYSYFTGDGGVTWKTHPLPADFTLGQGLYFLSPQEGLALGPKIYNTSDGGQTWKFIQQVSWQGQFSFVSMQLGWAHVFNDQGETALVKTVNGGVAWSMLHPLVGP
jgi:photosystem II stability/assembly factor-like uncharacterized protein